MIVRTLHACAIGWLLLGQGPAWAHEFWLEPSAFTAAPRTRVAVRLCVGDGYQGQSLARDAGRIEEFFILGPDGKRDVAGLDGVDPAGFTRLQAAGPHVIAYRSNRAFTEQPDAEFVAYLHEDGLEAIIPRRAGQDQPGRLVRESYSRYAKVLVRANDDAAIVDRPLGLALEVIAESTTTFRLLYAGEPLAGSLLKAMRLGGTDGEMSTRTGADGRGSFQLDSPGVWRVSAVHMTRPLADVDAEWDSLWASLTFEVPGATGTMRPVGDAHCVNRLR
jgi:uncharacterized GH25 family protein